MGVKVDEPAYCAFLAERVLTLDAPGTYRYSCGMGMYWGSITVVEAAAQAQD